MRTLEISDEMSNEQFEQLKEIVKDFNRVEFDFFIFCYACNYDGVKYETGGGSRMTDVNKHFIVEEICEVFDKEYSNLEKQKDKKGLN